MTTSHSGWEQYKAAVLERLDLAAVYADIKDQKPSGENCVRGLCPFHDDHDPSFGVDLKTGAWRCFAGCGGGGALDYLMRRSGRSFKEVLVETGDSLGLERPSGSTRDVRDVVYAYRDERGQIVYGVVRKPGKKWAQRRPNGKGGWIWNLKGVDLVLYNLPELVARAGETVYVVEGEKDADRLMSLGLLATTNSGGAGKWRPSYSEVLTGRDVVVLPDNDGPGLRHAEMVAKSLAGKARSVRVVVLPGLGPKQDVSDWLDAGGDRQQLDALVTAAPAYESGSLEMAPGPDGRPVIETHDRPLRDILDEAQAAVLAANVPPRVFNSAGYLARLRDFGQGPQIELLEERAAVSLLARVADWTKTRGTSCINVKPPKEAAGDIIVSPHPDLPKLDGVITTPVFDRAWRLQTAPGYHPETRLWLHMAPGTTWPEVPVYPSPEAVRGALSLILDDLLVDFPFTSDSDRAHAVAALLLPFARRMFDGTTPVHLVEASSAGSGKTLLIDLISIVVLGYSPGCTTITANEEETRKKVTALLSRGPAIIAFDNLKDGTSSAQLAAAITTEVWEDRVLGQTKIVSYPNRALWFMSANNPRLSGELARRCLRTRIDSGVEEPWKRTGFKHDPIREWAKQNRVQLVHAVLTLIQHWIASGSPILTSAAPKGSFETWSRIVGGMVQHFGLPGFLANSDEFYEAADPEDGEWRAFVLAWWDAFRDAPVGAKDLLQLAVTRDLVGFAYAAPTEHAQRVRFGQSLARLRDRRFGNHRVVVRADSHTKVKMFSLVILNKELFK